MFTSFETLLTDNFKGCGVCQSSLVGNVSMASMPSCGHLRHTTCEGSYTVCKLCSTSDRPEIRLSLQNFGEAILKHQGITTEGRIFEQLKQDCVICLDSFEIDEKNPPEEGRNLPVFLQQCHHIFHKACLAPFEGKNCPTCRTPMDENNSILDCTSENINALHPNKNSTAPHNEYSIYRQLSYDIHNNAIEIEKQLQDLKLEQTKQADEKLKKLKKNIFSVFTSFDQKLQSLERNVSLALTKSDQQLKNLEKNILSKLDDLESSVLEKNINLCETLPSNEPKFCDLSISDLLFFKHCVGSSIQRFCRAAIDSRKLSSAKNALLSNYSGNPDSAINVLYLDQLSIQDVMNICKASNSEKAYEKLEEWRNKRMQSSLI